MDETSPPIKDGCVDDLTHRLSVEDCNSFFQYQWDQFLSDTRSGCSTNLNFVSKSGEVTSAHQAVLLPLSSHLERLVETSSSCGCAEDVPTLLLPQWDQEVIEAMINLLYTGSVTVTGDLMEEIISLMQDLRFNISGDQMLADPVVHSTEDAKNISNSRPSLVVEASIAQNNPPASASEVSSGHNESNQKISWIKKIKIDEVKVESKNVAQDMVMKKMSEMLNFLECVQIKNEESLVKINKPLDDLLSSWKYLPTELSFEILPMEIKTQILGYLCNSGSFIGATVCHDWKEILNKKLIKIKELVIGNHCSNHYLCEDDECFMPEELLKASIKLKLKVALKICHPIPNVDSKLLADSLTSFSSFELNGLCDCRKDEKNYPFYQRKSLLTPNQIQLLIETLEEKNKVKEATFIGLNLAHMDQNSLINCILKIKYVFLSDIVFDTGKFIAKLLEDSPDRKLRRLALGGLMYPLNMSVDLADALGLLRTIFILPMFPLTIDTLKRLIENEFTGRSRILNFFILYYLNWSLLISHEELNFILTSFDKCILMGTFSLEQKEEARSLLGVVVNENYIIKWSN